MIEVCSQLYFLKLTQFSFLETPMFQAVVAGFYLENVMQR
jgi:hypothetical protein